MNTEEILHTVLLTVEIVCQVTTITVLQTEEKAQLMQGEPEIKKKNSELFTRVAGLPWYLNINKSHMSKCVFRNWQVKNPNIPLHVILHYDAPALTSFSVCTSV